MAKLYRRRKVWYSKLKIGGKVVRKALSSDRRIAESKLADLIKQRDSSKHGTPDFSARWPEFRDRYLKTRGATQAPRTIGHDRLAFALLDKEFPLVYITDMSPTRLVDLQNRWIAAGRTPSAINRGIRSIKLAMRTAESWYRLPKQDWASIRRVKERKSKTVFFTPKELKKIKAKSRNIWLTIFSLGYYAGLRRGEIRELRWDHVFFDRKGLSVGRHGTFDPKSDDGNRFIPMRKELQAHLEALAKQKTDIYVLGEDRPSLDTMTTYFKRIVRVAGYRGGLHTLRHTFGSHLARAGVPLPWIGKLMGHSAERITELYGHLQGLDLDHVVDKLPGV